MKNEKMWRWIAWLSLFVMGACGIFTFLVPHDDESLTKSYTESIDLILPANAVEKEKGYRPSSVDVLYVNMSEYLRLAAREGAENSISKPAIEVVHKKTFNSKKKYTAVVNYYSQYSGVAGEVYTAMNQREVPLPDIERLEWGYFSPRHAYTLDVLQGKIHFSMEYNNSIDVLLHLLGLLITVGVFSWGIMALIFYCAKKLHCSKAAQV